MHTKSTTLVLPSRTGRCSERVYSNDGACSRDAFAIRISTFETRSGLTLSDSAMVRARPVGSTDERFPEKLNKRLSLETTTGEPPELLEVGAAPPPVVEVVASEVFEEEVEEVANRVVDPEVSSPPLVEEKVVLASVEDVEDEIKVEEVKEVLESCVVAVLVEVVSYPEVEAAVVEEEVEEEEVKMSPVVEVSVVLVRDV